jgi:hypothetical protein
VDGKTSKTGEKDLYRIQAALSHKAAAILLVHIHG